MINIMLLPELFERINYDSDPLQIVKKVLNEFNNSHFPNSFKKHGKSQNCNGTN